MEERNKVTFLSLQNNILYTISTSLTGNKINLVCKDSNHKVFENSFSVAELIKISEYFKPNYTIEQVQLYLNGIMEKQKISISPGDEAAMINCYLINHDIVTIPLFKKKKNNNNKLNNIIIPPNNNIQNISKNNNSEINQYIQQIENLNIQLNQEKNKNKKLTKENNNLKEKIIQLNFEINKLKELEKQIIILENNLSQKNKEIQNIFSQNIKKPYEITSIKPGEKILTVNFLSMGTQEIGHFSLECKNVDLFVSLEERLYEEFPQFKKFDAYYLVNTRRVKRFLTLEQNEIKKNDIINIFFIE